MRMHSKNDIRPDLLISMSRVVGHHLVGLVEAHTFWGMKVSDWDTHEGTSFGEVIGIVRIAVLNDDKNQERQ